jgi:predicted alpha/beta-fold hydrolase
MFWFHLKDHTRTLLLFGPPTVAIVGFLWRSFKRYPSTIVMSPTAENQFLIDQCPSLTEYRPTPWIFSAHLMTILGVIFRAMPQMSFRRVLIPVDSTGGTVAVDWHSEPRRHQPILLILHGLTGGSDNAYIRWMVLAATTKLGVCCVVAHARGCGRSQLTSPRSFSAAHTDDFRASLKYIRSVVGEETPIFAVGYSLGAGILTKFLGEESTECSLQGAVVCCASFDMHLSTARMEQWLHTHLYNRRLTHNLIRYLRQHEHHFLTSSSLSSPSTIDVTQAYQSKTLRDFDTRTIVPQFGFRDVEHYYSEASSAKWFKYIRVPTLVLNAIDDPICVIDGLPTKSVLENKNIIAVQTLEGGHVSYLQGWWPRTFSYDNSVVVEYIKARLKQMNYQWETMPNKQLPIDVNLQ